LETPQLPEPDLGEISPAHAALRGLKKAVRGLANDELAPLLADGCAPPTNAVEAVRKIQAAAFDLETREWRRLRERQAAAAANA
jgi:hypothetical protein